MKKDIYVIKLSGQMLLHKKELEALMMALKQLLEKEVLVIVVHGGGSQADSFLNKLNIPIKKINGKRITDKKTLEIIKMIYGGLINIDLLALAIKNNISAIGLSGASNKLALVSKRPLIKIKNTETGKTQAIDFGYVGDIKKINKSFIENLLLNGLVPFIACLGVDDKGQVYNINADSLACAIASEFKAIKLIFVTNVKGVFGNPNLNKPISHLTPAKIDQMIENKNIIEGMIPKVENAKKAILNGVKNVQIVGDLKTEKEWFGVLNNENFGTIISGGKYGY